MQCGPVSTAGRLENGWGGAGGPRGVPNASHRQKGSVVTMIPPATGHNNSESQLMMMHNRPSCVAPSAPRRLPLPPPSSSSGWCVALEGGSQPAVYPCC